MRTHAVRLFTVAWLVAVVLLALLAANLWTLAMQPRVLTPEPTETPSPVPPTPTVDYIPLAWPDVPLSPENAAQARVVFQTQDDARVLAFSPDGALLATASRTGTISLRRAADYGVVQEWGTASAEPGGIPYILSFSPDGQWLAVSSFYNELKVWRVADGSLVTAGSELNVTLMFVPAAIRLPDKANVHRVCVSPGGIAAYQPDCTGQHGLLEAVYAGDHFLPSDDGRLATYSYNGSGGCGGFVWDLASQDQPVEILRVPCTWRVAYSPDGRLAVFPNSDNSPGILALWELYPPAFTPPTPFAPLEMREPMARWDDGGEITRDSGITSLAFSPDGRVVASVRYSGLVQFWGVPPSSPRPATVLATGILILAALAAGVLAVRSAVLHRRRPPSSAKIP